MAVDMFLKLDNIKGEATGEGHAQEIDVLSWSWGATQSTTSHMGGGGGSGKVNISDLSIVKPLDASTPELLKACYSGQHFEKALLTVRKAGGKEKVEYVKIVLEHVLVSAVQTGGAGDQDRLTETLTLNFAKVNFVYTSQDGKGGKGASIEAPWNIPENNDKNCPKP
jgi:type VI secretion system secreted protein Hcp